MLLVSKNRKDLFDLYMLILFKTLVAVFSPVRLLDWVIVRFICDSLFCCVLTDVVMRSVKLLHLREKRDSEGSSSPDFVRLT